MPHQRKSKIHKLETNLQRALYVLKIMKDKNYDGLNPSQIQAILTDIFGIKTEHNLVDALTHTDAIIIVTAHKEFHDLEPAFLKTRMKTPILIDSRGVVNQHAAKTAGLIFRGLGRGKI